MLRLLGGRSNDRGPGFADGLLATFALLSIFSLAGVPAANTAATAGIVGIISAIGRKIGGEALKLAYGVVGVFGTLAAVGHYFMDRTCGLEGFDKMGGIIVRIVTLLVFIAIPLASIIAVLRFRGFTTALGMYGLIESVTFVASPFGVNILSGPDIGIGPLTGFLLVAIMSLVFALDVRLAKAFSAIVIGLTCVLFDSAGLTCAGTGADYRGVTGLVTFAVVHLMVSALVRRRRR